MLRKKNIFLLACLLVITMYLTSAQETLPYKNSDVPVAERVDDLLSRMTLEEKIGQMTLMEKGSVTPEDVTGNFIGGVLSGGGGYPEGDNSPEAWLEMVHSYQDAALATRLGIPMIYGVDAVHGHSNLSGTVIFPHNIGLGATRNAGLVEEIGRITAQEMIATGIYWNYAPVLAVPQDLRWGRTYEGYSEDPALVTELSAAMLRGLQGDDLTAPDTVLATPKHFVGDGGTAYGTSPMAMDGGLLDRGVTDVDEETLRAIHLAPYSAAIENGARSIMVSYSSWGGMRMHGQKYLITDVLRDELGFEGFIVSDWGGINDVAPNYYDAVVQAINAGIDMNMVPYDDERFIRTLTEAVENGDVTMERIDEAVSNILHVKFELGLFERPYGDESLIASIGSEDHRAVAREAVSQSLVLLKNDNEALPLDRDAEQTVWVAGAADNIGIQSGGWTIEWQGVPVTATEGTSILEALEAEFSDDTTVGYSQSGRFDREKADIGIVVVGEQPYAEWFGDTENPSLSTADQALIERMRGQSDTLIVILLSGRPLVIDAHLNLADAFVAAWLPGTEGDGITDVLFGDKPFVGQLSYTWPRTVDQLPFDFDNLPAEGCDAPLFPFGYGLTYENNQSEWLDLAVECGPPPPEIIAPAAQVSAPPGSPVPEGVYGETYYAPFPVNITLDGAFNDWKNVPEVIMGEGVGRPQVSFGAAADDQFLYLHANVVDDNIISGEHAENYWNEDSVEFYINATGDLDLNSYQDGVAQITLPPINIGVPPDEAIISGVRGTTVNAQVVTVETDNGWAVEVALPLENDVWIIEPEHGGELGFQVHLNAASESNRDTKLIWSVFDTADTSYQNPSVFGRLIFHEVAADTFAAGGEYRFVSTLSEEGIIDDFENGIWMDNDAAGNAMGLVPRDAAELAIRQIVSNTEMAHPGQTGVANNTLAIMLPGGFSHVFTDGSGTITQDWSAYNALGFWLYGSGSGETINVEVRGAEPASQIAAEVTDDFSGWQYLIVPFDLFATGAEAWDWSTVAGYGLSTSAEAQLYLDDVRLFTVENTTQVSTSDSAPETAFVLDESVTWDSREWELVWADEFDEADSSPINSESWTCEVGGDGWGNNELEYYTTELENVSHNGEGSLVITALTNQPKEGTCWYGKCAFTSARCITQDKLEFTYGRVEARIKIPRGQGIWPAFWMLGANFGEVGWPNSGEIDIMENIGSEPQTVHGTVHGPGYSGAGGIGNSFSLDEDFADDYHVYAVDWDPNVIRWYVDGELYGTVSLNNMNNREWVFNHDFFILMNVAVGGAWPGFPDESTEFPQEILIDYVRVYQLK